MSAFKRLNKSDIVTLPTTYHKNWNYQQLFPKSSDGKIVIYRGINLTGSFDINTDPVTNGRYDRLVYQVINHTFYQSYTASLDTSSLAHSIYYESASLQRPTSSYFNYNSNPYIKKNFPSSSNSVIRVMSISPDLYGNTIEPSKFNLFISSSMTTGSVNGQFLIVDDSWGNLWDIAAISSSFKLAEDGYVSKNNIFTSGTFIGNIFYAHGLAVITNPSYVNLFPNTILASNNDSYRILNVTPNKTITGYLDNDTLDGVPITASGVNYQPVLGYSFPAYTASLVSGGYIALNNNDIKGVTPSKYKLNYSCSVTASGLTITSNIATITVDVYADILTCSLSGTFNVCNPYGGQPLYVNPMFGVPPYRFETYITNPALARMTLISGSTPISGWFSPTASMGTYGTGTYASFVYDALSSFVRHDYTIDTKVQFVLDPVDYTSVCQTKIHTLSDTGGLAPYTASITSSISSSKPFSGSGLDGAGWNFMFDNYTSSIDWEVRMVDANGCWSNQFITTRGRFFDYYGAYPELDNIVHVNTGFKSASKIVQYYDNGFPTGNTTSIASGSTIIQCSKSFSSHITNSLTVSGRFYECLYGFVTISGQFQAGPAAPFFMTTNSLFHNTNGVINTTPWDVAPSTYQYTDYMFGIYAMTSSLYTSGTLAKDTGLYYGYSGSWYEQTSISPQITAAGKYKNVEYWFYTSSAVIPLHSSGALFLTPIGGGANLSWSFVSGAISQNYLTTKNGDAVTASCWVSNPPFNRYIQIFENGVSIKSTGPTVGTGSITCSFLPTNSFSTYQIVVQTYSLAETASILF